MGNIQNKKVEIGPRVVSLPYNQGFDFGQVMSFMRPRAIPGLEVFTKKSYARTFRTDGEAGYFIVKDSRAASFLELRVFGKQKACSEVIRERVSKMFDLDTDFTEMNRMFSADEHLVFGMKNGHVPRLPVAFEPFEFVIRAILGQQISVKAATTLAGRIAEKAGLRTPRHFPPGLDYFFPSPRTLAALNLDGTGITRSRQETIKTVSNAVIHHHLQLTADQDFETFKKEFSALKGIGDWTVNYVAMRGFGMADAFPATDLGVIRSLTKGKVRPTLKQIKKTAENWRPYRAYAALCLWNQ